MGFKREKYQFYLKFRIDLSFLSIVVVNYLFTRYIIYYKFLLNYLTRKHFMQYKLVHCGQIFLTYTQITK